jgi:D-amino-acid dehydrogenase
VQTKVVIVGGGIIGILTAYFLNKKGFAVKIIEKKLGVGLAASLANGSQISFSHIYPMFFEKKIGILSAFQKQHKYKNEISTKNPEVQAFLKKQDDESNHTLKHVKSLAEISEISLNALNEIIEEEGIGLYFKNCGIIHLFNSKKEAEEEVERAKLYGQAFRMLSSEEMLKYEPNILNFEAKFNAGVRYAGDKTSNCHDICKILEQKLKERGVEFHFNSEVKHFKTKAEKVEAVILEDNTEIKADFFCLANGVNLPITSKELGLEYPIFPIRGYSYTFNTEKSNYIPLTGLIDRNRKMVYSLYKNYLRIAGFFDLGVNEEVQITNRMKDFEDTIFDVFPLLKRNKIVHKWTENRPFMPNSVPIIGKAEGFTNLLINGGHGALGFTLSFGSGKIISELI